MCGLKIIYFVFLALLLSVTLLLILERNYLLRNSSPAMFLHWIKLNRVEMLLNHTSEDREANGTSLLSNETPHGQKADVVTKYTRNKTILLYTALFNKPYWYALEEDRLHDFTERAQCEIKNCVISYDLSLIGSADAVLFHARDLQGYEQHLMEMADSARKRYQRWVYFTSENPENTPDPAPFDGLFNWTMTYRVDSDIRLPPRGYVPLKEGEPQLLRQSGKRKKLIVWITSNCGLIRDEVVYFLQHLLEIDVGGGCSEHFIRQVECRPTYEDCSETLSEYKFYLAFENAFCTEYITEKYWRQSLRHNLVPIVLGAGPYDNPALAIPGSFINVRDFKSLEMLAEHIRYLDKNDTAYQEYFAWKKHYTLWQPPFGDWPYASYFVCELCKMLHQDLPEKVYNQLSFFWDVVNHCYNRDAFLTDLLMDKP